MSQRSIPACFALCLVGLLVLLSSFPRWRTAGKSPAVDVEWKTTTHDNDADDASRVKQLKTKEKNGTTEEGKEKSLGSCRKFKPQTTEDRAKMDGFLDGLDYGSVKMFVMFWGFQRSGHSWIGAVLDASPNALIANEWYALTRYKRNHTTMTTRSLYDGLAKNSYLCGLYGRIQGYNYTMPGLWQGQVTSRHGLQVIGDKLGGMSTKLMLHVGNRPWESPADARAQSDLYDGFMKVTGAEPRNIIVLRNPFDIVASTYLNKSGKKRSLLEKVENVLKKFEEVLWAKNHLGHPTQWHVLTMEDFARNTKKELLDLCNFTGIECPESIISKTIEQTHHSPHQSRDSVSWTTEAKDRINTFIRERLADYYTPWTEE